MKKEQETQVALDESLWNKIPTGEAKELPPEVAWEAWDWETRMLDLLMKETV